MLSMIIMYYRRKVRIKVHDLILLLLLYWRKISISTTMIISKTGRDRER
jgi:hypothetical protein